MERAEIRLEKGETTRIDGGRGATVRVLQGDIWLTQYRDCADYMMRSGDSLVLSGRGATLITAYAPTRLGLEPRRGPAVLARFRQPRCAAVAA